jgi:hypothetical protein
VRLTAIFVVLLAVVASLAWHQSRIVGRPRISAGLLVAVVAVALVGTALVLVLTLLFARWFVATI